ncbi:peroxidase-like [Pollicipes pollicipes]|uniref:peroxidase-like n=1 Tax=Pollicipes pollicipes TaxID=41117 RepID=UPI001884D716|nr:peroxidase-like [Pollicipes pollicipes]
MVQFVSASGAVASSQLLRETFFEPSSLLSSQHFIRLARGVSVQNPQGFDKHFTSEIRGQLFSTDCFGLDLVSLNIQRGRDHGIAKYTPVLHWCTAIAVGGWFDLLSVMSAENMARLKRVYVHWDDVDLYAGLSMEWPAAGAMIGPTARCLLTEQFLRSRYGDRFFYDLAGQPGSFTAGQLQQLQHSNWARILCDNVGGDFTSVQRLAFFRKHPNVNPVEHCDNMPSVNLALF